MIAKVCLFALVGVACALPRAQPDNAPIYVQEPVYAPEPVPAYAPEPAPTYHNHPPPAPYKEEPKPYAFDYGVKDDYSGASYGHKENSDGKAVSGSYTVALPDGRIQRVTYVADHYNGFQAQVEYEGEANYPETKPYEPQPYHPQPQQYKPEPQPYQPEPQPYQPEPQPYQPSEPVYTS